MSAEVYGTFPSPIKAEEAISVMELDGFDSSEITVIKSPDEIKSVLCSEADMALSIKRGVYLGAIVGFLVGLGILVYTNSPAFNRWWGVAVIPIGQAFGWALFGMIAGSGGLLVNSKVPATIEHQFENAVGAGKILLAVRLPKGKRPDDVALRLYQAGAIHVHRVAQTAA